MARWSNGKTSDSRSEHSRFESWLGQSSLFFFFLLKIKLGLWPNKKLGLFSCTCLGLLCKWAPSTCTWPRVRVWLTGRWPLIWLIGRRRRHPLIPILAHITTRLRYADDTTAVLSNIESAHRLFQLLDEFKKLSGLKINRSKMEGMWIGTLKDSEMKPLGIKWPQDPIKALGVFFSYDKKLLYLKNFSDKLDNIKKLINIWLSRGLSLYGKVTIIKTLLLSKIVYLASVLPTPKILLKNWTVWFTSF